MTINPKLIAFAQTLFYGFFFWAIPQFITALGQGGALSGLLSPGLTVGIIFVLNFIENQMQAAGKGALFGTMQ